MNDLRERLLNVNEAGVYRLNCTADVLRDSVARAGLLLLEADQEHKYGKGEFLAAVAAAIHAHDWFGHNFDALADALGDLSWLGASPGYVLLLSRTDDACGLHETDRDIVMQIFDDTVAYWRGKNKPFWVFLG
ncbi:MAG: barstar family protein [Gallionellaceae bacterium]|jgi:hypothetical protein|nr:barstar family protein [Gallionellaceae bacterium]